MDRGVAGVGGGASGRGHVRLAGAAFRGGASGFGGHADGGDGSSKQRGHRPPAGGFSGRRGGAVSQRFGGAVPADHAGGGRRLRRDFFLYCEDTDLGLRARWAGWKCLYVPAGGGGASLFALGGAGIAAEGILRGTQPAFRRWSRIFPCACWRPRPWSPWRVTWWHVWYSVAGRGSAARFRAEGNAGFANALVRHPRARGSAAPCAPRLWRQRRGFGPAPRITPAVFRQLAAQPLHQPRRVAAL